MCVRKHRKFAFHFKLAVCRVNNKYSDAYFDFTMPRSLARFRVLQKHCALYVHVVSCRLLACCVDTVELVLMQDETSIAIQLSKQTHQGM